MRIIAGRYGGRRLVAPNGQHTRPTSDRVREALFSIIGPLDDCSALDLFAGTGALGLEALSRGATQVTFVESHPSTRQILRTNLDNMGIHQDAYALKNDVRDSLKTFKKKGARFDLILADPPYRMAQNEGAFLLSLATDIMTPDGQLIIESGRDVSFQSVDGLDGPNLRTYGDTVLHHFIRREHPLDESEKDA
jgi:16S rRNA (guanine966-N2)-methyltransferase